MRTSFRLAAFVVFAASIVGCQSSEGAATGAPSGTDGGGDGGSSRPAPSAEGGSGAPGTDAGGDLSDASASADATTAADAAGPGSPDASQADAAQIDPGLDASCADGSAGCPGGCAAGFHTCTQGCCPFGTTPILDSGSKDAIQGVANVVAADGTIHVVYFDGTKDLLVHAASNAGALLVVEAVATGGEISGVISIALDGAGEPVLAFETINDLYDTWSIDAQRRVGGAWSAITVVGGQSSYLPLAGVATAIDPTGAWSVFYGAVSTASSNLYLQVSANSGADGGTWSSQQPLSFPSWQGFGFDANGIPYVAGLDSSSGSYSVAQVASGAWTSETYAAPPCDGSVALDSNDVPVIAGAGGSTLCRYTGGAWTSATTPLAAQDGAPILRVDGSGNPSMALAYEGYIQIARETAAGWDVGTVGPLPPTEYPVYSMALDPSGAPVVCWVPYGTSSDPDDSVVCSTW